jgi:hypothetical protein
MHVDTVAPTHRHISCTRFSHSSPCPQARRPFLLALLGLVLWAIPSLALDHSGIIASSEIWQAADNPHVVTGNVTVNPGVILTLEPGVEVYFNAGLRMNIQGNLSAVGTPGQGILFTKNSASNWGYVYFQANGSGNLDHCTIEYSNNGINANSTGSVSVANTTLRNNTYGLYSSSANILTFSDCQVENNGNGMYVSGGSVDLASVTFSGNTNYGFQGVGVAPGLLDSGTSFSNNGTGLYVSGVPGLILNTPVSFSGHTTTGLHLVDCETPSIDNQTFTENAGTYGAMVVTDCGEFVLGAGNVIGGGGQENSWPLCVGAGAGPSAGSVIPATGNTNNHIQVIGGTSGRTATWRDFSGMDYVVTANTTISPGGQLNIEPGVAVLLNAGRRLNIQGTLSALGAPGQEILFSRNTASNWGYIYFQVAGGGTLDHCILEYSANGLYANSSGTISVTNSILRNNTYGSYSSSNNAVSFAGCQFNSNTNGIFASGGSLALGSTTFSSNTSYGCQALNLAPSLLDGNNVFDGNGTGLYVSGASGVSYTTPMVFSGNTTTGLHLTGCENPTIDNQTFSGNTGTSGAMIIADSGDFVLGAGNVIGGVGQENSWPLCLGAGAGPSAASVIPTSGNTNNSIQVVGGTSSRTFTWRHFPGLDYVLTANTTVSPGGELVIDPDVSVFLNANRRLNIQGTLTAQGAPGQEILFSRNGASNWGYIYFQVDGGGSLDHCIVEYAGNGLYGNSSGALTVTNSIIRNNTYGSYSGSANAMSFTGCQFVDNNYGIFANGGTVDLESTAFNGNTTYGFQGVSVAPTILDGNNTFDANGTGLYVSGVPGLSYTTPMVFTGHTSTGLHLTGCESPTIDNMTFTGNTGTNGAMVIADAGEFVLGPGNVIGGNGLENSWPLSLGAGAGPSAGSAIPTTGNINNDIQVVGGTSARTATWHKYAGLDYVVTTNTTVSAGGELIIQPDVNVYLDSNRRLSFQGTLTALGAPGQEILFSRLGTANWGYLYFQASGNGSLDHCIVEYSGNGIYGASSGAVSVANTVMRNNTYGSYSSSSNTLAFTGCQFTNNTYGMYASGGTIGLGSSTFSGNSNTGFRGIGVAPNLLDGNNVFDGNATGLYVSGVSGLNYATTMTFTGNTTTGLHLDGCETPILDNQVFTGNSGANGAMAITDCGEFVLGAGNAIGGVGLENSWPLSIGAGSGASASSVIPTTGNTNNDIQVIGGTSTKSATWRLFPGLNYIVNTNTTVSAGGSLIIDAGVEVYFDSNRRLTFQGNLTAQGTAGQEILFASKTGSRWGYLYFQSAGSGTLDHCRIEDANNGIYCTSSGTVALNHTRIKRGTYGVYTQNAADLQLSDCAVDSCTYGIQVNNASGVTLERCRFEGNSYGIYGNSGTFSLLHSEVVNNTDYGIYLAGSVPTFGQDAGEWNDIYGNGSGQPGRDLRNDGTDRDVKWVYWGTDDYGDVLDQTWDYRDDFDLGLLDLLPFQNATHDNPYSAVEDEMPGSELPATFALRQNAPNPFNPVTKISYDLPKPGLVSLKIYDVSGALVTTLINETIAAGKHEAIWRGTDSRGQKVSSGVYFYRLETEGFLETKQMTLLK